MNPFPLVSSDFAAFFEAANGYPPFPWQERLVQRVIDDGAWPECIDVPTGAGKTSCIDIAVFALACAATLPPTQRRAPRRIFFVVDRRVIVDEAFEHASDLADKLSRASDGMLANVAANLRAIAGDSPEAEPLSAVQLRGGVYRDDRWVRDPVQATVIASTVDQIGSRLLFRGYGLRGGYVAPIHAGMVGNDALIILDEAHCANPFRQTLDAVRRYRDWATSEVSVTPFATTILSATPPVGIAEPAIFRIDDADRANPKLAGRIQASKPATLHLIDKAKGKKAGAEIAKAIVQEVRGLLRIAPNPAIGVIVNRVRTAQDIHAALSESDEFDCVLLTGRMRSLDKDAVITRWLGMLRPTDKPHELNRPIVVVATQTLEVGANLDFDALVTECAAFDALRQRFGRLNRGGRPGASPARILARADLIGVDKNNDAANPDPVYGHALARTWDWLGGDGAEVDFGVAAIDMRIADAGEARGPLLQRLSAPSPDAMVLTTPHLDVLAQTSPEPAYSPEVSRFLHGNASDNSSVMVCWRADLDDMDDHKRQSRAWREAVSLCPPTAAECMPVPIAVIRAWLRGAPLEHGDSDLEIADAAEEGRATRRLPLPFLRWLGPEHPETKLQSQPNQIRPGDTIVVPTRHRHPEHLGHIPAGVALDQAEHANFVLRRRVLLRLHPEMLKTWPTDLDPDLRDYFHTLATQPFQDEAPDAEALKTRLRQLRDAQPTHWCGQAATMLLRTRWKTVPLSGKYGWALVGARAVRANEIPKSWVETQSTAYRAALDFSDEDSGSSATVPVTLFEHLDGVGDWANRFAQALGLPEALIADLKLAACLHDLGKADPRFQSLLNGGNPWLARLSGQLLAKGGKLPRSLEPLRRTEHAARYPLGARHELLSVRLAESDPAILAAANDPDLVLHLVASHHGRCRGFAPAIRDDAPLNVTVNFDGHSLTASSATGLERLDSGVSERFWRLVRRYGWWGLAWLESILRLADWNRSAQEQVDAERSQAENDQEKVA
ncbi:MAG: type I-U CRISPR-associated helicase/endonuclease Cas3 [Zoogloeaceae bacterium]|nr:type I-U CRISPR-associated helicase/endonuclease Cas3 [Zoogloeaceae bacterium]